MVGYNSRGMSGEEETETIEFYKIQLMEKEREISDFDSRLKKIEFRNNREVKEARAGEERARGLLKEEKGKVDRLGKQAAENQEQNNLLQLRLAALKEEKEREVLEVRAQYNAIKEEVRSYERILPTHTFLTELALPIQQLPTYEDLFLNLKQKLQHLTELQAKFDAFRQRAEEAAHSHEQSEELLRAKKLEADRNLKEVLPRVIELEHSVSDLRIANEELHATINDLRSELADERGKSGQLEQAVREVEAEGEQMRAALAAELQGREEEVRASFQEELERQEQELRSLSSRLEIKDNMYISQIHILEEEVAYAHAKAHADRERDEEALADAREELETAKAHLEKAKTEAEQLAAKAEDHLRNLLKVAAENEQLQERLRAAERKAADDSEALQKENQESERRSQREIKAQEGRIEELSEEHRKLRESYAQLLEEKESIREENQELRQEINTHKENSEPTANSLELPNNAFEYEEKYRRKSMEFESLEQELTVFHTQREELDREKERASELIRKAEGIEVENAVVKQQLEGLKEELRQNRMRATEIEVENIHKNQEIQRLRSQIRDFEAQNQAEIEKMKTLQEEKQRILTQNQEQKEKIASLVKSLNDNELQLTGSNSKQNFLKTNIELLKDQNKIILEQDKKNKELIKNQKEEIKTLKQANAAISEKTAKQAKDLALTIESLRQQRQQIRSQFSSKQKSLTYQIAVLKNNLELQQKLKSQLSAQNAELSRAEQQKQLLSRKHQEACKELEAAKKEIEKLEQENLQKDQENELINQSLDRERRERTLRTVPSLQSLQGEEAEDESFNDIYLTITRKEGEINILRREISDLREELESLRLAQAAKLEALELETAEYIQTIIMMKVKCAEAEMRASEKEHLYNQLKKRTHAQPR